MPAFPHFLRERALILEDSDGNKPVLTVGFFFGLAPEHTSLTEDLHTDRAHFTVVGGPFLVSPPGHGDDGKR